MSGHFDAPPPARGVHSSSAHRPVDRRRDDWNNSNASGDWFNERPNGDDWFNNVAPSSRGRQDPRRGGGGGRGGGRRDSFPQPRRYFEKDPPARGGGGGGGDRGGGRRDSFPQPPHYYETDTPARGGSRGRGGRGRGGRRGDWFDRSSAPQQPNNTNDRRTISKRKREAPMGNNTYGSQSQAARPSGGRATVFDETGVARKRVKGGRIAKVRKLRRPDPDLFCDVCKEYQYDENSKAGHDRGRKHLLKLEELRKLMDKEMQEKAAEPAVVGEQKAKVVSYEDAYTMKPHLVLENYKKAMAVSNEKKPHGYVDWCTRCVKQAIIMKEVPTGKKDADGNPIFKKVATSKSDPKLKMAIQREIMHVTATHFDSGTWYLQTWKNVPLATGKHYSTGDVPKPIAELLVPEAMVEALKEPAPMFIPVSETPAQPATTPTIVDVTDSIDVDMLPADGNVGRPQCMVKMRNTWRVSAAAKHMVEIAELGVAVVNRRWVLDHAYESFGRAPEMEKEDAEPEKDLEKEFKHLESQFTEELYDCVEKFHKKVLHLIDNLEKAGHHNNRRIQKCCEMLVHTAVIGQNWPLLCWPLERVMRFYRAKGVRAQREYVSHWVLSLVMRSVASPSGDGVNDGLDVALSTLPRRYMKLEGVRHSLGVLRAVLTNNPVRFFDMFDRSPFHASTENRSQYVMESLVDIVRQRAVWQWATPIPGGKALVHNGAPMEFRRMLETLRWTEVDEEENTVLDVEGAREMVRGWGMPVAKDEEEGLWLGTKKKEVPVVKKVPHMDVATIFGFMNRENAQRVE